eukprot:403366996
MQKITQFQQLKCYTSSQKLYHISNNQNINSFNFYMRIQKSGFGTKVGQFDFDPRVNYYQKLGLIESASEAEIKKAFYSLAKKYHPDSNIDKKSQTSNEEKFKDASGAYEVLSDTSKKSQYDEMRKEYNSQFGSSSRTSSNSNGFSSSSSSTGNGEYTYKYDSQGRRYGEKPKYDSTNSAGNGNSYKKSKRDAEDDPFRDPKYEQWRRDYEDEFRKQYQQSHQEQQSYTYNNQQKKTQYSSHSDFYNQKQKENFKNFYNQRQEQRQEWKARNYQSNHNSYNKGPQNQTYAPYYTPDGKGNHIFGRIEVKNELGELVQDLSKPYDAAEAHSGAFVAGMHPIEQEYYKRLHNIPKDIQSQMLPTNSLYDDPSKDRRGSTGGQVHPVQINRNDANVPGERKRRKKKNNFRDKQIEAYAKLNEQQTIQQRAGKQSLNQVHKASSRFDLY